MRKNDCFLKLYDVFERKKMYFKLLRNTDARIKSLKSKNDRESNRLLLHTTFIFKPYIVYLSILRLFTLNENEVIIEFNKNSMVILFRSSGRLKPITINDL